MNNDQAAVRRHPLLKRSDGLQQENEVLLRLLSESQSNVSKLVSRLNELESQLAVLESSPHNRPARAPLRLFLLAKFLALRPSVFNIVRKADAARDARKWAEAARLYEQAVAVNPHNGPIWVQLGNMRKEAGWLDLADQAYAEASQRMPRNADLHLQIGHLRKLMGDPGAARQAYRRALALDANNIDAVRELGRLG
jgi:tetratricopeptide (TPR) repeat protein